MSHSWSTWRLGPIDFAAGGALIAAGALTFLFLLRPHGQAVDELATLRMNLTETRQHVAVARSRLAQIEQDTAALQEAVDARLAASPRVAALNAIVTEIVQCGLDAGLSIGTITPQRPRQASAYVANPLEISAAGEPAQVVAFLETLAREHPYHAVRGLALSRQEGGEGVCQATIRLELFLLSGEVLATEDAS